MGRLSTLVMFVTTVGCSKGWPTLDQSAVEDCGAARATVAEQIGYDPIAAGPWEAKCMAAMLAAIKPCTEYKYGSDSAMQCLERRASPELVSAANDLLRREREAFAVLKEKVSGHPDTDREAWCGNRSRSSAEKAACAEVARDVAIERETKGPKSKKKDPLLSVQF